MLLGTYSGVLSPKRRTAVPSAFRKILGAKIIIAKWYEKCLVLVSESQWSALLKRLMGQSRVVTASVRDTERFILGSAYTLEADAQGRVVIPELLAKYANLGPEIVFLGLGERAEVWNRQDWERREQEISREASMLLERVANETKNEKGEIS